MWTDSQAETRDPITTWPLGIDTEWRQPSGSLCWGQNNFWPEDKLTENHVIEAEIAEDNTDVWTEDDTTDDKISEDHTTEANNTEDNIGIWTEDDTIDDDITDVWTEHSVMKPAWPKIILVSELKTTQLLTT